MLYVENRRYDSQSVAATTIQTPNFCSHSRTTTIGPPTAISGPEDAKATSQA